MTDLGLQAGRRRKAVATFGETTAAALCHAAVTETVRLVQLPATEIQVDAGDSANADADFPATLTPAPAPVVDTDATGTDSDSDDSDSDDDDVRHFPGRTSPF